MCCYVKGDAFQRCVYWRSCYSMTILGPSRIQFETECLTSVFEVFTVNHLRKVWASPWQVLYIWVDSIVRTRCMLMQPTENYLVIQEVLRKAFFLRDNKDWLYVSLVMFFFSVHVSHFIRPCQIWACIKKDLLGQHHKPQSIYEHFYVICSKMFWETQWVSPVLFECSAAFLRDKLLRIF